MAIEHGTLLLADISGYTKYLTGVELDHSQDILADLLGVVVGHLQGPLHLAKLEGDAVFCFGPDEDDTADGAALVTLVEGCFFAFQEKLRNIKNLTTCPCDACLRIPDLTLKFLVHHGEYVIHDVLGNRELVGTDVILAHRLLKNAVTEQTGLRGYALFTQACIERFGIDPSSVGMAGHTESYDDVGEVPGYMLDLEARWREEQERRVVRVEAEDALIDLTGELPAPPELVWEWLTSPTKRQLWQPGVLRVEQDNPRGVPGVGTTNHCVHGDETIYEEVLDWKPFDYFTDRSRGSFGTALFMYELAPTDEGGTRLTLRMAAESDEDRAAFEAMVGPFTQMIQGVFDAIKPYLSDRVLSP
jgi:uncharacterized protein YndB with AHSA1/START domain